MRIKFPRTRNLINQLLNFIQPYILLTFFHLLFQNENITKLKIDNNPFAKGFRDTGLAKTKRKANSTTSSPVSNESDNDDPSPMKRSTPSSVSSNTLSDDYLDVTDDADYPPEERRSNQTSPYLQPIVTYPIEMPYHNRYNFPQISSNLALITPFYYNYPMHFMHSHHGESPQDLSLKKVEIINNSPKKDFSIRSILSR